MTEQFFEVRFNRKCIIQNEKLDFRKVTQMHPVDDGPHLADSNDLNLMVFDTTIFKQVLDSMAIGH